MSIVNYKLALLAKQKGFNEEVENIYCLEQWDAERQETDPSFKAPKNSEMCGKQACSGPTYSELKQWLFDNHNLKVEENDIEEILKTLPNVKLKRPQEYVFW